MVRWWWFEWAGKSAIVCSSSEDKVIIAPDSIDQFVGKHIKELVEWMRSEGGFEYEELISVDRSR